MFALLRKNGCSQLAQKFHYKEIFKGTPFTLQQARMKGIHCRVLKAGINQVRLHIAPFFA